MREIKFRAWDKKYNMMIQAESFQRDQMWISGIGEVFEIGEWSDYGGGGKTEDDCSDQYILMQYTGLKDRNRKEIYEGDIVKGYWWDKGTQHRHIGTVTYVMNAFVVSGVKQYKGLDKELNPIYEVIGNIYEHPHLLRAQTVR